MWGLVRSLSALYFLFVYISYFFLILLLPYNRGWYYNGIIIFVRRIYSVYMRVVCTWARFINLVHVELRIWDAVQSSHKFGFCLLGSIWVWCPSLTLQTPKAIRVLHRIIRSWYTRRWWVHWVRCYIWYSEEGPGRAAAPPSPLLAVPNVTVHPSTANVPITVLLRDGPLLCGFNVAIKGLISDLPVRSWSSFISATVWKGSNTKQAHR